MIFGLREIGQKDFETVVESSVVVLVFFDAGAKLRDDFVSALNILRSLHAHGGHEHVVGVRVAVAGHRGLHVLHGGFFAGLLIAHVHAGHGLGLRLRRGSLLNCGALCDGGVVAGHGGQQNREYKNGAENHGGFRGEMHERSAR